MRAVFTSTRPAIARLFFVGLVAICMMALLALSQTAARAEDGSAVGSLESASPAEDSEAGSVRDVEDDSEDAEQEPAEQEDQEEVEALDTAPTAVDNGIPVLYLTITGGDDAFAAMEASEDHSVHATGSVTLDVPEGYTGDYSSTALADLNDLDLEYIRGRGNSTWHDDKKPYKFKLKKGADLLGMGKNKHWILLANSFDDSLLRNRLVNYMGAELGLAFTPQGMPVDVVVNGNYHGSYFLCEQVRVGSSRVDIDELTSADNTESNVTGGYLLAMRPDESEPEGNVLFTTREERFAGVNPEFATSDPEDAVGTEEQKAYITQYLQDTEDAIFRLGEDDANGTSWTEYMDGESAAKYWWVQEFTTNIDAFSTPSTYLYKQRDGKLYWGPLWDFDQSLGFTNGGIEGFSSRQTEWLDRLRGLDPNYQQQLKDTWATYDAILENIVRENGVLDQYAAETRASWEANHELYLDPVIEEYNPTTFDAEVEQLRDWINARRAWINDHLETDLTNLFCKITFMANDEVVDTCLIYLGEGLYTLPDAPQREGMAFAGWVTQEGTPIDDVVFTGDTVVYASYTNETEDPEEETPGGSSEEPAEDTGEDPTPTSDPTAPDKEPDPAASPDAQKAILSFDLAGGTLNGKKGIIKITAKVGATITLPAAPKRSGYVFVYWKGSSYPAGAEYKVEGNHLFTAQWKVAPSRNPSARGRTATPATGDAMPTSAGMIVLASTGIALLTWGFARRRA